MKIDKALEVLEESRESYSRAADYDESIEGYSQEVQSNRNIATFYEAVAEAIEYLHNMDNHYCIGTHCRQCAVVKNLVRAVEGLR